MSEKLIVEFKWQEGLYNLTFEDDGKVAYAYLKNSEIIVGDVWLYNRCPTPDISEWDDPRNIPFANCNGYIAQGGKMLKNVSAEDVFIDWDEDENGPVAYVYIFEDLYGVLGVNDKPGYARFVTKSGPVAKVMEIA